MFGICLWFFPVFILFSTWRIRVVVAGLEALSWRIRLDSARGGVEWVMNKGRGKQGET